ncbi:MAG: NPCBM/NEW2 domain-containing protein [Planctomycetota bacterium]
MAKIGWRLISVALIASTAIAKPPGKKIPLRDLHPAYVKSSARVLRSRSSSKPGLFVAAKRYRGLNVPAKSRIGYDLEGNFATLRVKVAVLDGSKGPLRFFVHGRGRVLAATPPLFPGVKPLELEIPLEGVLLLELEAKGRGRGAWIEGVLQGADGEDLSRYHAIDAPFNPRDYPASFRHKVNDGIDRAVKYLRATQQPSGLWTMHAHTHGTTALATLALLKAGVMRDDPAIAKAFAQLRKWQPNQTYTCSVLLMAIEARYFPRGGEARRARAVIPAEDQAWIAKLAAWLVAQQGAGFPAEQRALHPVWRYPHGGYDLSNTQYALFGLTAANRCGVATQKAWLGALRYVLGAQEKEGPEVRVSRYFRQGEFLRRRTERAQARGFGYTLESKPTGAMTSAGLCSLVLCQQALTRNLKFQTSYRQRTRHGIRDALAWLEEYYDLVENPFQPAAWWTYYLFNVGRVGVLLDQRYIGTRDWYREGSELLLGKQEQSGRVERGQVETAFALLFWKRATVPARTSPLK